MFFPLGSLYIYYHSARIQAAFGGFGRFGNFGYYCLQVRVARALRTGALAFGQARVIRRRTFACNCGIPAQIATHSSRLQRSSPNGDVLLRTEDLFPNCGVPSRAAEFFVQLRQFLANAGALAGLSRLRACLAHLTATSAAEVADGKFGLRLVCWLTAGQRQSRRQTYGWRVAAGNSASVWVANPAYGA